MATCECLWYRCEEEEIFNTPIKTKFPKRFGEALKITQDKIKDCVLKTINEGENTTDVPDPS